MNRLVIATAADLDTPKSNLGRRLIRSIAPDAKVSVVCGRVQDRNALDALKGVDVLFGCVDNDGARLVLNELALGYRIPYFDVAVGITVDEGVVLEAGGRVAVVLPGMGPCLYCMGEIDPVEARYFLSDREQQRRDVERGYVKGVDVRAPSVVSLNGAAAAAAVNEFAMLVSGVRHVNFVTEIDIIGSGRSKKAQWTTPVGMRRQDGCVQCAASDGADGLNIQRYGASPES